MKYWKLKRTMDGSSGSNAESTFTLGKYVFEPEHQRLIINKEEIKPINKDAVEQQNAGRIDKGDVKPISNQSNLQKDSRNTNIRNYDVKTPDAQRNDIQKPSARPTTVSPRNEKPVYKRASVNLSQLT